MKCPDCDTRLSEIKLEGDAWVYRCFKCGGFWIDSWSVNRLNSKVLSSWRRIGINEMWTSHGKGMCPQDGMLLQRYRGESIPPTLSVSRCVRCGKWWFPGDTLFSYKPAVEAKISYFQQWGLTGDLTGLALPILSILILVVGLGLAVNYAHERQSTSIHADSGIKNVSFTPLGYGRALVSFESDQNITQISYRMEVNDNRIVVPVVKEKGIYIVNLEKLSRGMKYIVTIGGKDFEFNVY